MSAAPTLVADFPLCTQGPYRFGRALRREHLDGLLVERALALDVTVLQPARVHTVQGKPGALQCDIDLGEMGQRITLHAAIVIDAHGSWQRGPAVLPEDQRQQSRRRHRPSDLFAFKTVFQHTTLSPGLLPVMALAGGYGGMVIADEDQATLACCLRRDALAACRSAHPGLSAGEAVEACLRRSCLGVREALDGAQRLGPWLTVGPLRPGTNRPAAGPLFRVGNAAGESHALVGEGIGMALQSAVLLAHALTRQSPEAINARDAPDLQRCYQEAWRQEFSRRMHVAALFAHIAMRPRLARPARALMSRWPALLTAAARLAGKARLSLHTHLPPRIHHEHA
jgi:flavin-dependent dehydrogenase